jgi:hypothetical protein
MPREREHHPAERHQCEQNRPSEHLYVLLAVFAFSLASPDDSLVATGSAVKGVSPALEATEVPSAKVSVFKKTVMVYGVPVCKFGMFVPMLLTEKGAAPGK